jgi:N-methylhydantoinase A
MLGVDIGGTFTDLVYIADDRIHIYKLLSTRDDPAIAFLEGMRALAVPPEAVVAHGTTVATNAVLEHKGARTGLIATRGFRDMLFIGRQARPALSPLLMR